MDDKDLKIDDLRLEEECAGQPTLYFHWADKLADAKLATEEARVDLGRVKNDLSIKIRKDPNRYGVLKETEGAFNVTIEIQPEYRKAQDIVIDAEHFQNRVQGKVTALEHRKRSLTLLVELSRQRFYAEPTASPAARRAVQEQADARTLRMGQRKPSAHSDRARDEDRTGEDRD